MLAPMTPPWPATTQSLRWVGLLLLLLLLHRAAQICSWLVAAVLEQRYYNAGPVPLAATHTTTHSLARLLTYQRCGPYSGCMQVGVDIPERQQIAVPAGGVRGQYVIIYTGYLSEVRAQAGGQAVATATAQHYVSIQLRTPAAGVLSNLSPSRFGVLQGSMSVSDFQVYTYGV